MTLKNPEYDFKWCPGCGDFGVRRGIEGALQQHVTEKEQPISNTVVVAGIGCSGNMVHMLEKEQPFGIHGIHGRSLPLAFGIKMANPELNVLTVAGDGDFLGIGMEHIGPQAQRNLNITAVVMDNGVYGLTKGTGKPGGAMKAYLDNRAKKLEAEKKKQKPEYKNNPAFGDPSHHSNKKMKEEAVIEHHQKDADGKVIEHEDTTPSSVEEKTVLEQLAENGREIDSFEAVISYLIDEGFAKSWEEAQDIMTTLKPELVEEVYQNQLKKLSK